MRTSRSKKGISLMTLVLTIIVMIILAGAVILALSESGVFDKVRRAILQSDLKNYQEL